MHASKVRQVRAEQCATHACVERLRAPGRVQAAERLRAPRRGQAAVRLRAPGRGQAGRQTADRWKNRAGQSTEPSGGDEGESESKA